MQKLSKFLKLKSNVKLHIKIYGIYLRHIRRKFIFLNIYINTNENLKSIKLPLKNVEQ